MQDIGKLIGSITILYSNNFYNNNNNIIIDNKVKNEIINFLSHPNLKKEIIKFVKEFKKKNYENCEDYLFLLGINNFYSTIMLVLNNYEIENYLIEIEGSYCIIKQKLNYFQGNILKLFLEDEAFFFNLILTLKNNIYKNYLNLIYNFSELQILEIIENNKLYYYQNIQENNEKYLSNLI